MELNNRQAKRHNLYARINPAPLLDLCFQRKGLNQKKGAG